MRRTPSQRRRRKVLRKARKLRKRRASSLWSDLDYFERKIFSSLGISKESLVMSSTRDIDCRKLKILKDASLDQSWCTVEQGLDTTVANCPGVLGSKAETLCQECRYEALLRWAKSEERDDGDGEI